VLLDPIALRIGAGGAQVVEDRVVDERQELLEARPSSSVISRPVRERIST
jgi:hypothetical protein